MKALNVNKIAPLLIASFDIECTSSHGDFPLAKKNYKKLAQDLTNVSRNGYDITKSCLINWIQCILHKDVIIDDDLKIHKIYTKKKINYEKIPELLENNIDDIIKILDKIYNCEDESDEEERENLSISEINKLEDEVCKLLTKSLPELEGDEIIQIGTTVHKYGSDEIIYKNIITLNTCDKIDNCDVVECKTEKEVILEWKKLISDLNPDVLIGYNIFGFDLNYIWDRSLELNINEEFSFGLGRKITRKSKLFIQELSLSALGDNTLKYIDYDGIVIIDLFKVMQREYKLDSYKLDNVASIYLGDKKMI